MEQPYHIKGDNFERAYREHLSDFPVWCEKGHEGEHAEQWMVHPENFDENMALDETAMSKGELHTLLTRKSARCKQGTIGAMVEGTNADEISAHIIANSTEEQRSRVKEITMDFSENMHTIAERCFPEATKTIDLFHLIRLLINDMQDLRVRLKREARSEDTKARKEWQKRLEKNASRRKEGKKDNRGRPAERKNAAYKPEVLSNGDTVLELLTRSRYLLTYTYDDWSEHQKERATLLFERYPLMKTAYDMVHRIRMIFKSKTHTKESAKEALDSWCEDALTCGVDEFIATVQTIQSREDEVLNYFVNHQTNAYAESFNSKIKNFRAQLRGVSDKQFFFYRLSCLFG